MQGYKQQVAVEKAQSTVKNGVWEIILTDPRLNKFTFGPSLIGQYVMTDILSPFGNKSVLYSTIPSTEETKIVVDLHFDRIDDCNISGIRMLSTNLFFKKWRVNLVDNRTGVSHEVTGAELFEVSPHIIYNKLFGMGFMPRDERPTTCYFELHLEKK